MTLKEMRKNAGLTQQQVGKKLGCSNVTIMRYELGMNEPSAKRMAELAELYSVSLQDVCCAVCRKHESEARA